MLFSCGSARSRRAPGERGATPRLRKFVTGVEYQCGNPGEKWLDRAFYNGLWYRCLKTHTPTGNRNPYDDIGHDLDTWEVENDFSFLATECAIVGSDGNGWILKEGTITHTSGKIKFGSDGSADFNNNCKISPEGILYSKGGVFEGRLQIPFKAVQGFGHVFDLNTGSAIVLDGSLTLPEDPAYNGYMLEIWGNNVISRMSMHALLYGKIILPWLTQDDGVYTKVWVASYFSLTKGGYLKLISMGDSWAIIAREYSTAEYDGGYETVSMFPRTSNEE